MSSGWILGANAVNKVSAVFEAYQRFRLKQYNEIFQDNSEVFHPCMPLVKFSPNYNIKKIVSLSNISEIMDFNSEYLGSFNELLRKQSHLGSITDPDGAIELKSEMPTDFQQMITREVEDCLGLMKDNVAWMHSLFEKLISKIHPIVYYDGRFTEWSASDFYLIGLIFTSVKGGENARIRQGITLAHELSHNAIYTLQTGQDTLVEGSHTIATYSCIRKVERPLRGAFHAAVALTYMTLFLRAIVESGDLSAGEASFCDKTLSDYRPQLKKGLRAINGDYLTSLGKNILVEMELAQKIL